MICYRDRTYCDAPCSAECDRMVTPEVEQDAERVGLPLAIADLSDLCTRRVPPPSPPRDTP